MIILNTLGDVQFLDELGHGLHILFSILRFILGLKGKGQDAETDQQQEVLHGLAVEVLGLQGAATGF